MLRMTTRWGPVVPTARRTWLRILEWETTPTLAECEELIRWESNVDQLSPELANAALQQVRWQWTYTYGELGKDY